ncbi:MAG: TCP-1/cpn60 chaperonin family protein [Nitrososphaerota archaeon]|jgi:thermosome|nr:TCP-1/cpn60 chaperonin family protein [Nitrososphaerota archaeon]MDG6926930.1 TCP-1/cpn60 chaperonin family protein [Nitrososphaerota archaeon]MDG6930518.1 TCP-1/cpn60 chaperonin family protein [Nitrososphaerota archaeon]MDG6932193.1 TCP-1/cpn60 chaperonin family protein [Nitrososphaerota archaeon]MDG6935537.1 TCP-1/cpn60 chaperonin family protein [Nitrososphaerota archaeon]
MTASGQPVLILKEGTTEKKGREAQRNNFEAVKLIRDIVKSSLGPRGMDKMLVDSLGDVTVTNDGATILKEMDVQHPAAKMMVEISKATDNEVGDGTTSTVVLAGYLVEKAEELIQKGIHPTIIIDGYMKASVEAVNVLKRVADKVSAVDKATLKKIAMTTIGTKVVSSDAAYLSDLIVDAVTQVADQKDGTYRVDIDNIKVEKKPGASIKSTMLIKGVVVDKEVVHAGMPKTVKNAKIALLNAPLEIEKTEIDAKINITDPEQMKAFLDEETKLLKDMVEKIKSVGANVVLCQKGIDDMAQHYLAKEGILAVRRIKMSDMDKLARATGGRNVTSIDDLSADDLGYADVVEERKVEEDKWVFIEGCKNPKAVTLLVRGGAQRVVDEAERSIHDALMTVKDVIEKPSIVAGGGAAEIEAVTQLRKWAGALEGRVQLAAYAFADALEMIPMVLAENAGLNPLDVLPELQSGHQSGKKWVGINVLNGKVEDMLANSIIEPEVVKEQVIKSATEVASMIIKIDDLIAAGKPMGGGQQMPRPE